MPPSPRSVTSIAICAARSPSPSRAASTTMRASRGGSGSARRLAPSSVMRPSVVERADLGQQLARFAIGGLRRRIEKGKLRRIGDAPLRQIEREARKIGGENLRPRIGFERGGFRFGPQSVANSGLGAAGAAAALIGGGARHPHGLEPRQPDARLEARHPREAAIDDDAHAFDGERGLGDRGREHHLAPARRRRLDGAILHLRVQSAIQRDDVDRWIGDALSASNASVRRISAWPGRNTSTEPVSARKARITASATCGSMRAIAPRAAGSASRQDRHGRGFRQPARRPEVCRPARRRASPT